MLIVAFSFNVIINILLTIGTVKVSSLYYDFIYFRIFRFKLLIPSETQLLRKFCLQTKRKTSEGAEYRLQFICIKI